MSVFDKYECEGQMSLFDLIEPQEQPKADIEKNYLEDAIMRGTVFVDGKKRVYELYQKNMTPSDRANAIKKEYGLGGAGWPLEGYGMHGYDTYHGGLKIEWRDETGEHEKVFQWKQVEEVIRRLVDSGKYYQPPKKRNCAATNEECNHENCKKVAIECLDIDCKAQCCQSCTEMCGARCNYSAHQPRVLKEYIDLENQTWVDNPNFHADGD